ncbi:hypothetical protein [Cupriavidus gilardii]|uniref:hypothetical protein n=1 Tax=Cupriavidus gilardii TaxID=82541 RepID=UPI001580AAA3|nr:hypothetical protein [Cupriavidus gilardii]MCT9070925.1 hypothetical protein [Cupriavidus gilardii]QKS62946.1 hypothetical protein FOB47_13235 [Cupriavidus gilardii]
MLELAAKAAGLTYHRGVIRISINGAYRWKPWNPRDDDGDALRLLVTLRLDAHFEDQPNWIGELIEVYGREDDTGARHCEAHALSPDPYAAARLAILRAAAEVGRNMPEGKKTHTT